jgi:hypothetical protein
MNATMMNMSMHGINAVKKETSAATISKPQGFSITMMQSQVALK